MSDKEKQIHVTFSKDEVDRTNERIKEIKKALIEEGSKKGLENIDTELWNLFVTRKILEQQETKKENAVSKQFLKLFLELSPQAVLYILRNIDFDDSTKPLKKDQLEFEIDKEITKEEFYYFSLSVEALSSSTKDKARVR